MITNKVDYIKFLEEHKNHIITECRDDYNFNDNDVISIFAGKTNKYPINNIIKLNAFYNEFKAYIDNLKIGDIVKDLKYNNYTCDNTILKINRFRTEKHKGQIKSISVLHSGIGENKSIYSYNMVLNKEDIVYKNIQFGDLLEVMRTFNKYLFFSEYNINHANKIIEVLK
jgi:hypothetical protein